jgi:lysyl-tRNA synthetase, class I
MLWFSEIAALIDTGKPHVINDSKTPSGRVHVGSLRGVIMHDAMFRVLKARGASVRYCFGVDDYDPVDEIPAGQGEHFEKYRGAPLCNVPAPAGSSAPDMAEHFISELFDVFGELGVEAERYRMRDFYRSGSMNESIDKILANAATVRRIYKEVSN